MALVPAKPDAELNRRFNWMGSVKTETHLVNVAMLRDFQFQSANAGWLRRDDRRKIVNEAKCYLDKVKHELHKQDESAEESGTVSSGLKRELTLDEERHDAAINISCLVRGARYRSGHHIISFYDGTSHEGVEELKEYNDFAFKFLSDQIAEIKKQAEQTEENALVPQPTDTKEIAMKKLQMKESLAIQLPLPTDVQPTEDEAQLWSLSSPTDEETKRADASREKFNVKCRDYARTNMLKYAIVRLANIHAAWREMKAAQQEPAPEEAPVEEPTPEPEPAPPGDAQE